MSETPETPLTLPDDVLDWIASVNGGTVINAERIPGGGTREGWFVDLDVDGTPAEVFLRYSAEALPPTSAFHKLSTEAQVVSALGSAGAAVAQVIAVHPDREAVLLNRVPGETWFYRIKDPDEQVAVAQDFIRSLAQIHRLDPRELDVPAFGPVLSTADHARQRLADIRARAVDDDGRIDPLVRLSLDWLEKHVPSHDGPTVLVQGDTGPGNFMYRNGKVTAVLDWELSHWGDPMDDIAWLSLRTVQDTFTHFPDRLREYEQLSGHALDPDRIWYYRLFAETTMATLNHPRNAREAAAAAEQGQAAVRDMGNAMLYTQLHRRLWLETLNQVMELGLERPEVLDEPERHSWRPLFGYVQGSLKTTTSRITDPLAVQWTKGVARMARYLEQIDQYGRAYEQLEAHDLSDLLGTPVHDLDRARAELVAANSTGLVSDEDYVRYLWNKVHRDDYLMRTASGALHTRTWPPLI